MDKDGKGQRKLEDSGGGILPEMEGHDLEQNRNLIYRIASHDVVSVSHVLHPIT